MKSKSSNILLTETEREVIRQLRIQQKKGRQRYNVGLSFKQSKDPIQWAQEIIEELIDGVQYAVAFKLCLERLKKEGRLR